MLSKKAGIFFNFVLQKPVTINIASQLGTALQKKKTFIFLKREYKLVYFRFVHFVVV